MALVKFRSLVFFRNFQVKSHAGYRPPLNLPQKGRLAPWEFEDHLIVWNLIFFHSINESSKINDFVTPPLGELEGATQKSSWRGMGWSSWTLFIQQCESLSNRNEVRAFTYWFLVELLQSDFYVDSLNQQLFLKPFVAWRPMLSRRLSITLEEVVIFWTVFFRKLKFLERNTT